MGGRWKGGSGGGIGVVGRGGRQTINLMKMECVRSNLYSTIFVNYNEHIIKYKKLTVASRLTTLTTQDRASPSAVSPPSFGASVPV